MPPKRGRGRGRRNTPEISESYQAGHSSDNRGRAASYASSHGSGESQKKYAYPSETSREFSSGSSTSKYDRPASTASYHGPEESRKKQAYPETSRESSSGHSTSRYDRTASTASSHGPEKSRKEYAYPSETSRKPPSGPSTSRYDRAAGTASSHGPEKSRKEYAYPSETSRESFSGPSTSRYEEDRKGRKIGPEDIGFKYQSRSSDVSLFPMRPGVGKEGRHIKVISNCYPIKFPTGYVYHYDVEVMNVNESKASDSGNKKYRCLNSKKNREVVAFMLENNPVFKGFYGAFDGQKNLLTKKELKIDLPFTCTVMLPSEYPGKPDDSQDRRYENFKVEIKSLVSRINLDSIDAFYRKRSSDLPQEAIMAVETILRHGPCLNFTPIGRCFFSAPDLRNMTPFGGGLDIWFGYHQSIRLSQWKPTVNLDVSATTFWKEGPVVDFIAEILNMSTGELRELRYLNKSNLKRINQKLKQKQIRVTHLSYGRKYRILGLRELSANQEYIELTESGNKVRKTVAQYFKDNYKKDLKYGNLPCLQVQPEKKNIYMPIEVCELLPGQHYKGELTPAQKSKMIEFTSSPPYDRFKKIQNILHKANFNEDKVVRGFGLEVSDRPLIADARVLKPPNLVYKDRYRSEKEILPRDGSWNVRETQFFQGAKISSWVLLSFQNNRNLDVFADLLKRIGRNLGLRIDGPSDIIIMDIDCDKARLFHKLKEKGNELAVVVIPTLEETDEKQFYAEIKKAAETAVGLATQCIKAERLRDMAGKRGPQIANNLCLKINAKLGGENHSLFQDDIPVILCKPVIIIGADVNHPAPTQPNQPSIAACVGSLDSFGKRFAVSIRLQVNSNAQKKKVEKICDLEDMVYDLLLAFYQHTRQKPEKIIFYRDGVSEGELVSVKKEEVVSIRKACRRRENDYKPGITVIVVQKRHHVRFKPKDERDSAGRMKNIPPGTVIDTEVTHPVNFDFFLCSQYGLQGTSRPSHYLVVEDDNDFSADELQKLTFHLCHMYVRCTKSISIPAPVAYADLVAYRARKHLDYKKREDSRYRQDCSQGYRLAQDDIDAIQVVERLKDSMYFV